MFQEPTPLKKRKKKEKKKQDFPPLTEISIICETMSVFSMFSMLYGRGRYKTSSERVQNLLIKAHVKKMQKQSIYKSTPYVK